MKGESTTTTRKDELLEKLKRDIRPWQFLMPDRKSTAKGWSGHCPFPGHPDRRRSYDIDRMPDGVLLGVCRSGTTCSGGDIIRVYAKLHNIIDGEAIVKLKDWYRRLLADPPSMPQETAGSKRNAAANTRKFTITEKDVERWHRALLAGDSFMCDDTPWSFLDRSGLYDAVRKYRLGYIPEYKFKCRPGCVHCKRHPALTIPLYWKGELISVKMRNLDVPDVEEFEDKEQGDIFKDHKWAMAPGSVQDFIWQADQPPLDPSSKKVMILEGMRDTMLVREQGLNAVGIISTSCIAADKERFKESVKLLLDTYDVIIIVGDNDGPGEDAKALLKELFGTKAVLVTLPDEVKDITAFYKENPEDAKAWLKNIHEETVVVEPDNREKSIRVADEQREKEKPEKPLLEMYTISEIEEEPMEWLWPDRIPLGSLTVFTGVPDSGKTITLYDIIAKLTTGAKWPDANNTHPPAHAVILQAEEDLKKVTVPRLKVAGVAPDKTHVIAAKYVPNKRDSFDKRWLSLKNDLAEVEKAIKYWGGVKLLVIDPITSYCGDININKEVELRDFLAPIKEMCERLNITCILQIHFNKRSDLAKVQRVMGAAAMAGLPRMVWSFERDESGEEDNQFKMVLVKGNITENRTGLLFTTESVKRTIKNKVVTIPKIVWKGTFRAKKQNAENDDGGDEKKRREAIVFLQEELRNGPQSPECLVFKASSEHDISRSTLYRARVEAGVQSDRVGRKTMWRYSPPKRVEYKQESADPEKAIDLLSPDDKAKK